MILLVFPPIPVMTVLGVISISLGTNVVRTLQREHHYRSEWLAPCNIKTELEREYS